MRWFESPILRSDFDHFFYRSPVYSNNDKSIPIWQTDDYSLSHPDELVNVAKESTNWLLFVNSAETHCPYGITDPEEISKLRRIASYRNAKKLLPETPYANKLMQELHARQVDALRSADRRIKRLFSMLERPFGFLVTADHGESFGEDGVWGHVHSTKSVIEVPLWEGIIA